MEVGLVAHDATKHTEQAIERELCFGDADPDTKQ